MESKTSLGDFVKLEDGRLGRVWSATQVQLLTGGRVVVSGPHKHCAIRAVVKYSPEYSLLVAGVFDLSERIKTLEDKQLN